MWTVADQIKQYSALNHNQLQSVAYQIRSGGIRPGEVEANMEVFDRNARRITLLKTYESNTPYKRQDR